MNGANKKDDTISAPRRRRAMSRKHSKANQQKALLTLLRSQARCISKGHFSRATAPELFDLAMAADAAPNGSRSFAFCGVRFPMAFGWRRYVLDPETGETLVSGGFLA